MNQTISVNINWKLYNSYDEASSEPTKGIYIHDWENKPYYIGKLKGSTFGTRYNSGQVLDGKIDEVMDEFIERWWKNKFKMF